METIDLVWNVDASLIFREPGYESVSDLRIRDPEYESVNQGRNNQSIIQISF